MVSRALVNSLLSLLLLTTSLWGGCTSCDQYFMVNQTKSCCDFDGQCKSKIPATQGSERDCQQIAFDHQESFDFHVDLPVSPGRLGSSLSAEQLLTALHWAQAVEPLPPDRQVLHSIFQI